MTTLDMLRFSGGSLRGHRLRSGLSLLGVAIGVASVIVLTSLGEGARVYLTDQFASLGTNLIIVLPGKTETTGMAPIAGGVPRDLTLEDIDAVAREVREARAVAPLSLGEAPVRYGQKQRDITVLGTTSDFLRLRRLGMRLGRYLPEGKAQQAARVCVIGTKVQRELFEGANPLGEFLRLGDSRFRVIGVMAPRGTTLGMNMDDMVHVPVRSGMKLFDQSGLSRVFIDIHTPEQIDAAKASIETVIRERHRGEDDVTLLTQKAMLSAFGRILVALTAAIGGIAAISLSVAGIGIMNVMLVSVSERTAEIGLLKALGAGRSQILTVFLVEAAILSCAGGLLGLAGGYALDRAFMAVYPAFPVRPPQWAVYGALALSVLVGVVFGLLPARRAARLEPVAALGSGAT
jgi:putative ABC transport system permease protein